MRLPYHAPARASFRQKLGPGGAASLTLAVITALGGLLLPLVYRLRQVLWERTGDGADPVDAILVLGRRLDNDQPTPIFEARLAHALDLWRRSCAPRIFVAGGTTGTAARSEAEVGRDWLVARGVPKSAILLEDRSQHTLENLFNVRSHMRIEGWRTLLIVSDPLHLSRARATAGGLALTVRCSPAPDCPPGKGTLGWWRRAFQEAFLLHWYHVGVLYSRLIQSEKQLERVT